ncbi:hypothetical protein [Paraflavitalea speifideaquila]|uniref:hypothetical protein n=1 Tax=Paraflavitalea speifideaquila TaxID=3076558 RepID=UPI0028E7DF56|nr:hypothetical protein [Paraflavitalea speifideiaquila]
MILPLQEDTAIVNQLVRFKSRLGDSMTIIGLVCVSACNVSATTITGIYESAIQAGVIISAGSTALDPGTEPESLLKWLTDKSNNNRQTEPGVTGSKYFLTRQGKLYAQLGGADSLDLQLAENIARTKVPGEY